MATTAPPTINYQAMCDRVNALRNAGGHSKAAADAGGVEDPREKGTASIPSHPDGDNPAKTRIPDGARPTNTVGVADGVTGHVTNPGGTGENQPPAPGDQNAKDDAFTSPTTSLDKIAKAAGNLKALRDGSTKSATAGNPVKPSSAAPASPAKPPVDVEKTAADIQLSDDAHIKLASEILADESGRQWAFEFLNERHGEKVAHAMIQNAADLQREMEKAAAEEAYMAKQAAEIQDQNVAYVNEMLKHASAQEREIFFKCAKAHHEAIGANYARDIQAQYLYKAGAADAGMAQAMMAEGGDPSMPVLPGAGEAVEGSQIEQVIAALVQSGEITPEEATAIMAALAGGEGAAPAGGEEPPSGGGEEAPAEEPTKEASAADITQEIFDKHRASLAGK